MRRVLGGDGGGEDGGAAAVRPRLRRKLHKQMAGGEDAVSFVQIPCQRDRIINRPSHTIYEF